MVGLQTKKEEIETTERKLISRLHWLPAPAGLFLAGLKDDPAWLTAELSDLFSPRELDGRDRTADAAARSWFLGRLAAKAAAGRRWRLPLDSAEIRPGPEGRPWSFRLEAATPDGFISLSHTSGAAAAVAAAVPVGLDLELRDRPISDRVWTWVFTPAERSLAAGETAGFPSRLALWCAKEAAAKSWGRGLLNNLDRVRVTGADWPSGRLTAAWLGPKRAEGRVSLLKWDDYLLALAQSETDGLAL